MTPKTPDQQDDRVSRRRYQRQVAAREEAEALLELKSRELYEANLALSQHSESLEAAVAARTADLTEALEMAENASAARSRFIATMSHEIRTPLAGLLGMIELLSLDETVPDKIKYLDSARQSGEALNRIVNDVLDFSKMEAGLFVFEQESVDIHALTTSVVTLARASLADKSRAISAQVSTDVPRRFLGDATRIRQVLANLVSNAVKFSDAGPIELRLSSSSDPKGARIRVEVLDQGVGIPPERIDDLFKDFSQVSNLLTTAAQGTGLGLAISKRIVEGIGGEIGVVSELHKGSMFWFEIPVTVLTDRPSEDSPGATVADTGGKSVLKGKRILLAEDNPINQTLLTTYLSRMEINCTVAENGRVACATFSPGKFDLILMDVAMPEMDGLEATKTIRDTWPEEDVPPIIVLTAHVMNAIEVDARSVGAKTVLSKPISFATLEAALVETLGEEQPKAKEEPVANDDLSALFALIDPAVRADLVDVFPPETLRELVERYVSDGEGMVAEMLRAFDDARPEDASQTAHSLNGASRQLGFMPIADAGGLIEFDAETLSKEDVAATLKIISTELQRIEAALNPRAA